MMAQVMAFVVDGNLQLADASWISLRWQTFTFRVSLISSLACPVAIITNACPRRDIQNGFAYFKYKT